MTGIYSLDIAQIRLVDILKRDPVYRKWFAKNPYLPPHQKHDSPWWLYLQEREDGPWKRAKVETYAKAYKYISSRLSEYHDFSITSRRKCFLPPQYRPEEDRRFLVYWHNYPQSHNWCPYCRRPTLFRTFERHHADVIRKTFANITITTPRCSICGIRRDSVQQWINLGR